MPSPFSGARPHPLAERAAAELRAALAAGLDRLGHNFEARHGGKMFGVLVVQTPDGQVGYLSAFSGLLGGEWLVGDFAPPVFDLDALNQFWPKERAAMRQLSEDIEALKGGRERAELLTARAQLESEQAHQWDALKASHRERKASRATRRADSGLTEAGHEALLGALEAESWDDKRARARFRQACRRHLQQIDEELARLDAAQQRLERERAERSARAQARILSCYRLENFRGEQAMLEGFYAPHPPSGGAGDCAAPKLLAQALRLRLRPMALAEFWWGRGSAGGERRHGAWYPACRSKCEPILPWMLRGVPVAPVPLWGAGGSRDAEPATVYEDAHLVIVHKPAGLLSVPGRTLRMDSVKARLAARYPEATGPLLVHRLDLDTSGLLIMARRLDVYRAMQRLFAERRVEKTYVACLDGEVCGREGRIELPLRLDYDRRPRQMVDREQGRAAVTRWRVISVGGGQTRVAFYPETGRTHQLRVHAAHPEGLGCPIVGDAIYGRASERMLLHAESLRFEHPVDGRPMCISTPALF